MKVVPIMLEYDYGIKSRGESLEKKGFLPAIENIADKVIPFWLEINGLYENKMQLQKKIINFVDSEKPDIVFFILMNDEVSVETIEYLSKKYITINWFCDDQWRFDTFTKNIAPKLTYSVTTDKFSLNKYKRIGYNNVILSQWASYDYVENIDYKNRKYKYDVSFVGGKNPTREWIVKSLAKKGINVECFGAGWQNGRITYEEIKDVFLYSKINLNLSNSISNDIRFLMSNFKNLKCYLSSPKRVEQIKARNFEIPCFGGFQLTNYVPGIEDYFIIGSEIAVYTCLEDLALQISYYLENPDMRERVAIASHDKARQYTYKMNIERVFSDVVNREKGCSFCK